MKSYPGGMLVRTSVSAKNVLKEMVEVLATRKCDFRTKTIDYLSDFGTMESSSVEAYLSGENQFCEDHRMISMPYFTSFCFTCIRTKHTGYQLVWGISLS
jgi:hypothetical protein